LQNRKIKTKIKSPSNLVRVLAKNKKRIVFTNGCFDILHSGHIKYLEKAKSLGDYLVVALNSDTSVKRLGKGPGRPINKLEDRLWVVAALEKVDFVTWFNEDTPVEIIKKLKPKVLVKGGDWKVNQIAGSTEVKSWGGCVKSLPFHAGKSTSSIFKKIAKNT